MPFYSEIFKRLSDFEVSPNLLWIAGISFIVAFVFLLREFFSWMVKQNEIRHDLSGIKSELEGLRELLKESKNTQAAEAPTTPITFPLNINPSQDQSLEN